MTSENQASAFTYTYTWDDWVDFMEDNHRIRIPEEIEFADKGGGDQLHRRPLREASLDELSTALVQLEKEIERLASIREGLLAVHVRARDVVTPGSMSVHEALFRLNHLA